MHVPYTVLAAGFALLAAPWFAWRAWRHGKYVDGWRHRIGQVPPGFNPHHEPSIWIHAVSVGEVLAARTLVPALRHRYPHLRIVVSTTTRTGQDVARARIREADHLFYFPLDLPWVVRRWLDRAQPVLFLMMETELWPNLLRACRQRGVKTALVNGRISDRSFPRYRLLRPFIKRVLEDVDVCCAQSEESGRRLRALGADPARVVVTGSLKFDAADEAGVTGHAALRAFRGVGARPVFIAASTLRGEDAAVLRAFRRVRADRPDALLVIAPRHPERFDEVERLCVDEGLRVVRRTALAADAPLAADIVVLDTIGELAHVLAIATVVFVGGSLVDAGGHNILEPAVHGKPVVFGPHMQNFAEIASAFLEAHAAVQVPSADALASTVAALFADEGARAQLASAARGILAANRGARERTLAALDVLLPATAVHGPTPFAQEQG